jgi:hypothetical protein
VFGRSDYAAGRHLHQPVTDDRVMLRVLLQETRSALTLVCNHAETAAMNACLEGADTAVVAAYLGVSHLPPVEQRRATKRFWDAVIKRCKRTLREQKRWRPRRQKK